MEKAKAKKDGSREGNVQPKQEVKVMKNYDTPSYYATRVESKLSKDDACIQFMEMIDVQEGKQTVRHVASVWVSIAHYKAIYEMMGRQIKKHESQFGFIDTGSIGHEKI